MNLSQAFRAWRDDALTTRSKFVRRMGIMFYGGMMGLIFAATMSLVEDLTLSKLPIILAAILILGPLCGWLWGHSMWKVRYFWKSPEALAAEVKE
jgi:hypothetical protein